MKRIARGLALLLLLSPALAYAEYDECEAGFIAAIGADAYQFSPLHAGRLGGVQLHTLLTYRRAAQAGRLGRAYWRLEVIGPDEEERVVRTERGTVRLDASGTALVEVLWNGRDDGGRYVEPGHYRYRFEARYLADGVRPGHNVFAYEDLADVPGEEAYASTDEVVVNYQLTPAAASSLRLATASTVCQRQQNTPIEAGFGYNYYYGSGHSHSNYSDGGHPTTDCNSGNGTGTFDPAAVYSYARNTSGMDYWIINEHNHLIDDALSANNPPVTESKVHGRYAAGLSAAQTATVSGSFVALYGMEWGVTTNTDQGHVTLIETPVLFGWDTCTTCGATPECTAGTNCYFDVYTPKRSAYLTMYQRSVQNPSSGGALGILCHPAIGNFDNYAFDANADATLQGIAVRSGNAFTATANCADANVASTDYVPRWKDTLNRGFHLGPTADHDAHCNVYGQGLPNRTVYLLPNGASPVLTRAALLAAHKARHFFATEDSDAQLVFATGNGTHIMGDIFSASGGSNTLRAALYDPDGDTISTLELWRGQIGAGIPSAAYKKFTGVSSFSVTETLTSGSYYYFVHAVQADGQDLWSAPMWITYGP